MNIETIKENIARIREANSQMMRLASSVKNNELSHISLGLIISDLLEAMQYSDSISSNSLIAISNELKKCPTYETAQK